MLVSSLLLLCIGVVIAVPMIWIARAPDNNQLWTRFAGIFVSFSIAILLLGLYWQPPIGAIAILEQERRKAFSPGEVEVPCEQASEAAALIERTSAGQIRIEGSRLLLPGEMWRGLPEDQKDGMLSLARQIVACLNTGGSALVVEDKETEERLR